jgi:phosphate acetyltransferase
MLEINQSIRVTTVFRQDELDRFSDISGDHNPIHTPRIYELNPDYQGGVIVQGMLAASRFGQVLGSDFPGAGTINKERTFQFKKAVYVDQPYLMELKLASVDTNQHSATLLLNLYTESGQICVEGRTEVINERIFTIENYPADTEQNVIGGG